MTARLQFHGHLTLPTTDKEESAAALAEDVKEDHHRGFAGFKDRASLKAHLQWMVYGKEQAAWRPVSINRCAALIERHASKLQPVIGNQPLVIHVFPCVDAFVAERMSGVAGYTPWQDTIIIAANGVEGWERAFVETFFHEVAHVLMLRHHERKTLRDDLVFEGVAEHFKEAMVGGSAPWVGSLTEQEARRLLKELEPRLDDADERLAADLFFGSDEYPLWAGYAAGYWLVHDALMDVQEWKDVFSTPPYDRKTYKKQ